MGLVLTCICEEKSRYVERNQDMWREIKICGENQYVKRNEGEGVSESACFAFINIHIEK
jgi:hypothetical protein